MRLRHAILLVALLATTGDLGPFRQSPEDLSAEFHDAEGDANGLPAAGTVPVPILDARALYYASNGHAATGFRHGVPYNEWIVPIVFSDESGARSRSLLLPGLTRFHAWYGEWVDRDGDRSIDARADAANEWTGLNDGDPRVHAIVAFITPGDHPSVTSDGYATGLAGLRDEPPPGSPDFEYVGRGNGEWISAHTVPFVEDSLLARVTVTTVANGLATPGLAPGYTCVGGYDPCLVDEDRYTAIEPMLGDLYATALVVARGERDALEQELAPTLDLALATVGPALAVATDAALAPQASETDASDAYASMTVAHGAPRAPGGYDYLSDYHAYVDLGVRAYVGEPTAFMAALSPTGVPGADRRARGLSPMLLGVHGLTGIWRDDSADGVPQDAEMVRGCGIVPVASTTTAATAAPGEPRPQASPSLPTLEYQNHPSGLSDGVEIRGWLEAVDDAGEPTTWGAAGAYVLGEEDGEVFPGESNVLYDEIAWDLLDFRVDRHVTEGAIEFRLRCDEDDPGRWFSSAWYGGRFVLLPEGTRGFNLRLTMQDGLGLRFTTLAGDQVEAARDVDWYGRWA